MARIIFVFVAVLLIGFLWTQFISPLARRQPVLPFFSKRSKLEDELDDVEEEIRETEVESDIVKAKKTKSQKQEKVRKEQA